jgi:tripartite-type tricarboxylate transporter receptor subunit TctC
MTRRRNGRFVLLLGSGLFGAAAAAAPAFAQSASRPPGDDGFPKQVRLVIGYTTGGGYDVYARALARFIGSHLPGEPGVVPQNMPGAGSLVAANWLYNNAPKDGSAFAAINRGIPFEPLMDDKAAKFDSLQFGWIGSLAKEINVTIAWHTAPVKTWRDLIDRGMIAGGTGTGADSIVDAQIMNHVMGAKIKVISGYPGAAELNLALERGEVEGRTSPSWSSLKTAKPDWISGHKIVPLWQLGLSSHADLKAVPLMVDLVKNDDDRKVLEFFFARQEMGRPYMAPPGLPPTRLAALRAAFMATTQDPAFLDAARKQDLEVSPLTGPEVETLIRRVFSSPPPVIERARQITQSPIDVKEIAPAKSGGKPATSSE